MRTLIIEERVILACPHCWTEQQIRDLYPELLHFPISQKLCERHFQMKLTTAMFNAAHPQKSYVPNPKPHQN